MCNQTAGGGGWVGFEPHTHEDKEIKNKSMMFDDI